MTEFVLPHPDNFCGRNFQDWLEVYLTGVCNGNCSWCIDRMGFRPKSRASCRELADAIIKTGKKNILLLGGEPTLYPELNDLLRFIIPSLNVYLTTNGGRLTQEYIAGNLPYKMGGINLSIHHYDLAENYRITNINLTEILRPAILTLNAKQIKVRLNCNCIKGYIDSEDEIYEYIQWAKGLGVGSVRFAELKQDTENFVNLAKIMNYQYGLNDNPYQLGCNKNCTIDGMLVNFRQMCGFQIPYRPKPDNPQQIGKKVLYYDGIVYDGWQSKEEQPMKSIEVKELLQDMINKEITPDTVVNMIKDEITRLEEEIVRLKQANKKFNTQISPSNHCQY